MLTHPNKFIYGESHKSLASLFIHRCVDALYLHDTFGLDIA